MSRRMPVTVDSSTVPIATAIRAAAQAAPMLVLTGRAFNDLARELGGIEAAVGELLAIAEANNRPVGVNFETGEDSSSTAFISPRSWSQERLTGWVGAKHQELTQQFGEVTRLSTRPNRAERRRRQRGRRG